MRPEVRPERSSAFNYQPFASMQKSYSWSTLPRFEAEGIERAGDQRLGPSSCVRAHATQQKAHARVCTHAHTRRCWLAAPALSHT